MRRAVLLNDGARVRARSAGIPSGVPPRRRGGADARTGPLWVAGGPALCLLAVGCDRLLAIEAQVEGATAPLVVQGLVLGLDLPDGVVVDAEQLPTSGARAFVAYVSNPSELEESPVGGADVRLSASPDIRLAMREDEEGKYLADTTDGLAYEPGATFELEVEGQGEAGALSVVAPSAPDVDFPASTPNNQDLRLRVEGRWDNLAATAYNVGTGQITWDSLPDDVGAIYAFSHLEEPVNEMVVPAEAIRRAGSYVIAVAGLVKGEAEDREGVNTTLSTLMAGQLAVALVTVE